MIEKSGFIVNLPFQKWQKFWRWAYLSLLLIVCQLGLGTWWVWQRWQAVESLQLQQASLQSALVSYDEIVRKKNKFLAAHEEQKIASQRASHAELIGGYLVVLEQLIPVGVWVASLNFSAEKIELTGVAQSLEKLSLLILKLHGLNFVVSISEQIMIKNTSVIDLYEFTINLKLQS